MKITMKRDDILKVGMFNNVRGGYGRFDHSLSRYDGKIELEVFDCPAVTENLDRLKGCEALILTANGETDELFWKTLAETGVKYVATCSAGYDHFNLDAMKKYGLKGANVPFYSPNAISEHAVLLMLSVLRNFREQIINIEKSRYSIEGLIGKEVRNQTIGIVGAGRIGYTTMKCLSGFGPEKIYAYDPYQNDKVKEYAEYVSLDELYEKCDVIIYHCIYNKENHHMVNADTISKMKDGVYLINVARGGLFDNKAVYEAVCSGKIAGLGLDVIEGEENIENKSGTGELEILTTLLKHPNVIFTPHSAFYTDEADRNLSDITIDNIYEYMTTGTCKNELVK